MTPLFGDCGHFITDTRRDTASGEKLYISRAARLVTGTLCRRQTHRLGLELDWHRLVTGILLETESYKYSYIRLQPTFHPHDGGWY